MHLYTANRSRMGPGTPGTRRVATFVGALGALAVTVGMPFMILATTASASEAAAVDGRELSDANISDVVEDELLFDATVPLDRIDIETSDGIVTLTGTVSDVLARERAARIATTVKGVRAVVNQIVVAPRVSRTDDELRRDVTHALLADPAADSYEVEVSVTDGIVSLSGEVDSWREKQLAEKVAKSVSGVEGLENEVVVSYDTTRADYEIQAEVEGALEWDVLVDDGLIDVAVNDGAVTLSGTVGSVAEKNRAISDAWVAGVDEVEAEALDVARWARDSELRKHKYVPRTDAEVERAVEAALLRDPRVSAFDVDTSVTGGIVTLRGEVGNLKAKRAAAEGARNTVGALDVVNRIKVRPVDITRDIDLRENVEDAIARDPIVESYEINVTVQNGEVTLAGEVDSYYEKFHADDVASRVEGVVWVDNNLDVDSARARTYYDPYVDPFYFPYGYGWYDFRSPNSSTFTSDAQIENDVEDELFWSPFVDSDRIGVTVDNGIVTLSGTVDSWAEMSSAVENAYEGGALGVDNDLLIEPSS